MAPYSSIGSVKNNATLPMHYDGYPHPMRSLGKPHMLCPLHGGFISPSLLPQYHKVLESSPELISNNT